MLSETAHLSLANHNQKLIRELYPRIDHFPDWICTIAFYKALHVVEAVFANNPDIDHAENHGERERYLKLMYPAIFSEYRPLKLASMAARYMHHATSSFTDQFSIDFIRAELLGVNLARVEALSMPCLASRTDLHCIDDPTYGISAE